MKKVTNTKEEGSKIGRTFSGVVYSTKMKDTIVVRVNSFVKHPKYGKYVSSHKNFKVHNPGNTAKVGEKVEIIETRPISKDKKYKIKA